MVTMNTESKPDFVAFLYNGDDLKTAKKVLDSLEKNTVQVFKGGIQEAISYCKEKKSPKVLIIDISHSELPLSDLSQLLEFCEPNVKLVVVGVKNDVGLYRDLMKMGVSDYLITPLLPTLFSKALKSTLNEESSVKLHSKTGKLVSFISAGSGAGSTTLAANFAYMLSARKLRRVAIMDLDLQFGTVALHYNAKGQDCLELFENPERIDDVLIEHFLVPINERQVMIANEGLIDERLIIDKKSISKVLTYLKKQFHYIVLDFPPYINEAFSDILSMSDVVVIVGLPTISSLRDMHKLLKILDTSAEKHLILLLNKVGQYSKGEMTIEDFETTIQKSIDLIIPFDGRFPLESLNEGKPLVEYKGSMAKSVVKLLDIITGTQAEGLNKKVFKNKLLSFFKLK